MENFPKCHAFSVTEMRADFFAYINQAYFAYKFREGGLDDSFIFDRIEGACRINQPTSFF
jgi:hypothetical protein